MASKSIRLIKDPYTIIHQCNKITTTETIIASVDPGVRNFALRIEGRDIKTGHIRLIAFHNVDLTDGKGINTKQSQGTNLASAFMRLTAFMKTLSNILEACHLFIIERQLPKNYMATRIAQHAVSFLVISIEASKLPTIIEVSARLKGQLLGAPKGTKGKQLKKWSVEKAIQLLTAYQDTNSLTLLSQASKRDDLADTFCQIEAFLLFYQCKNG